MVMRRIRQIHQFRQGRGFQPISPPMRSIRTLSRADRTALARTPNAGDGRPGPIRARKAEEDAHEIASAS